MSGGDYKSGTAESITKSMELVDWEILFNNKTVHKQLSIFN